MALHAADRAGLPVAAAAAAAAPSAEQGVDGVVGPTVLVLGAGAVGLLCCAVSKVRGAGKVVVADINADRVAWAQEKGFADAGVVVPMKRAEGIEAKLEFAKEVAALIGEATTKRGEVVGDVEVTFECTGVESCLQAAIYVSFLFSLCFFFFLSSSSSSFLSGCFVMRGNSRLDDLTILTHKTPLQGHTTRRSRPHHRHGQPHPDTAHLGRFAQGGRPRGCVSLRPHVPARH